MDEVAVVTCFLRNRGEVLLLRRAEDAETYPGRWGAVTGYVEQEDPLETARMEIEEETGITDPALARAGEPFTVVDEALERRWRVYPVCFDVDDRDVTPNEETDRAAWTSPTAILRRETVPDLWRSYEAVAPTPGRIAADAEHGSAYLSLRALEALRDAAGRAAVGGGTRLEVTTTAEALLDARPSMAVVRNRVNRAMAHADSPEAVEDAAVEGIERALSADGAAAREAATLLDGGTALTLSRSGTVLAALRGGASSVVVAESRPSREGVGVAERLADDGLDVTLCTDAAVGHLLSTLEICAVLVGADAILPDGRVVNKTGTRLLALAADHEGVPCYVVAASDKVQADDGVHLEAGDPGELYAGDAAIAVENPTFDVTPADLVSGVVTERGLLDDEAVAGVSTEHAELAGWRDR